MTRVPSEIVAFTLLACLGAQDEPARLSGDALRVEAHLVAKQVTHLNMADLLYLRQPGAYGELATQADASHLAVLLTDSDPRTRAVAIAALYVAGPQPYLAQLAAMVDDVGAAPPQSDFTMSKQSVGDVARSVVEIYLGVAGYRHGLSPTGGQPGFRDYWKRYGGRPYCLSWFILGVNQATNGTFPVRPGAAARLRELRRAVDAIPSPDREWTLLAIGSYADPVFADQASLVAAAQRIGPEQLMKFLGGSLPPSGDPDMQIHSRSSVPYSSIVRFVLRHAAALLRREDVDELLALERRHREPVALIEGLEPIVTMGWAIAAADLQPSKSAAIKVLLDCRDRFRDEPYPRYDADSYAVAVWKHGGIEHNSEVVDWFFDATVRDCGFAARWFLLRLGKPHFEPLLRPLLADRRIESLKRTHLQLLARAVNSQANREIVSELSLRTDGRSYRDMNPGALGPGATVAEWNQLQLSVWRRAIIDFGRGH